MKYIYTYLHRNIFLLDQYFFYEDKRLITLLGFFILKDCCIFQFQMPDFFLGLPLIDHKYALNIYCLHLSLKVQ